MEHVPTLCAIGTVGIAATGFALGRPDSQPLSFLSTRRRKSVFRGSSSISSPLAQSINSSDLFHLHSPSPASASHPVPPTTKSRAPPLLATHIPSTSDEGELRRISGTIAGDNNSNLPSLLKVGLRQRRRTFSDQPLDLSDDPNNQFQHQPIIRRPSSSWIKRLSTISSSPNAGSPSGSCPQSPSIQGSTRAFLPPYSVPHTPNKLVKRSDWQRVFPASSESPSAGLDALPPLPRPATSHRRLATMRQRSSTESRVSLNAGHGLPSPLPPVRNLGNSSHELSNGVWRPFFGPGRPCPERRSGKRVPSARQRNRSPRRITPQFDDYPTLLLATDIAPPDHHYDVGPTRLTKPIARPASCGFAEVRHHNSFPRFQGGVNVPGPHSLSVEEKIANTPPALFKVPSTKTRSDRGSLPLSHIQPVLANTHEPHRPAVLHLDDKFAAYNQPPDDIPHTQSIKTVNPDHRNRIADRDLDFPRTSLRRVPSFLELRSERRPQTAAPAASSRSKYHTFPDSQFVCNRISSGSSGTSMTNNSRNHRHSATASDPSTIASSENDTKVFTSGEEDETDFQSETAFDSFSTRAAVSNKGGRRGPRIETIFDRPDQTEGPLVATGSMFESSAMNNADKNRAAAPKSSSPKHPSTSAAKNCNGISTPSRGGTTVVNGDEASSPHPPRNSLVPKRSLVRTPDKPSFSIDNQSHGEHSKSPKTHQRQLPASPNSTLSRNLEADQQKSLFDWSEQPHSCKDARSFDFRPKTAHAKQLVDARSGRSSSRGPASSLHLRSQSVPISRENSISHESLKSSKFGTWGLGNKGASEDWDGDFEFDDNERLDQSAAGDRSADNGSTTQTMKVPRSIMERQESLHGQFGHVQELTVLVEELKRLRVRAKALGILDDGSSDLWREAQGIVNLATSEDDEDSEQPLLQQQTSSPASMAVDDFDMGWGFENPDSTKLAGHRPYPKRSPLSERINPGVSTMPPLRTDSSAKAKRVLDSIYQQRGSRAYNIGSDPQQKMPFDTQSLRDLVVRAGVVTRALKEVVRKAEGVGVADQQDSYPPDPPFRLIFSRPPDDSITLDIQL